MPECSVWPIGNARRAVTFGQRRTKRKCQKLQTKLRNVNNSLDKCRIRRPWAGRTGSAESIRICCWRFCCRWPIRRRNRWIRPFGSLSAVWESEIVRRPCTLGGPTLKRASLVFWPTIPAGTKQTITTLARYDCVSGKFNERLAWWVGNGCCISITCSLRQEIWCHDLVDIEFRPNPPPHLTWLLPSSLWLVIAH